MSNLRLMAAAASILAAVSLSESADAAIVILTSPPGATTDENVLFVNPGPSNPLLATTNRGTSVTFTGNEALIALANGQAKITGSDDALNALTFFLTDPSAGMSAVEFSLSGLNGPGAPDDVTATISFFDQFGVATTQTAFPLGNGQTWFAASTTDGSIISRVEISTSADIRDVRHVRFSGADFSAPIPEPATWAMMIGGFGLIGGALRSRRRTTLASA